jgi:autotransporter passenger strand-loop-strand repeat protein
MTPISGYKYILSGETSGGLEILHGGLLFVSSGGTALNTTVDSGGQTNSGYFNPGSIYVYSGGVASATQLRGTETVLGLESGGTVFASGTLTVNATGKTIGVPSAARA